MIRTGLLVHVYRGRFSSGIGGVSDRHQSFVLTEEGVEGPFRPTPEFPELRLVRRTIMRRKYLHAEPVIAEAGWSFGGNFVFTSDSRFPNDYPIPVHDRRENAGGEDD